MMSTKFPAYALLMELATYMRKMSLRTVVEWAPREVNKEADKLAKGNAEECGPSLRIHVSRTTVSGRARANRSWKGKKRKLEECLRVTGPW